MTTELPHPSKVRHCRLCKLPRRFLDAVTTAIDCYLDIDSDRSVRIETYRTADIQRLVEEVWQWPCTLAAVRCLDDRLRVEAIIKLLRSGKPRWPYVSYWASDFEELWETEDNDGEQMALNHGDGWHRIIATVELGKPTIEILFLE